MTGPLRLRTFGSFFVGGRFVERQGGPERDLVFVPGGGAVRHNPNGSHAVEHLYVQYFAPEPELGQAALHLWHGGGLTGSLYESRPDGAEGWLPWFVRRGWRALVADGVERGRSGWGPEAPFVGEPVFTPVAAPYERFRLQSRDYPFASRNAETPVYERTRLPTGCEAALSRYFVPRWTTTDRASADAYISLIAQTGASVIVAHSQSAQYAFKCAAANPGQVRAIVAVEPTSFPADEDLAKLAATPILLLYGDQLELEARWRVVRERGHRFARRLTAAGGRVESLDLPEAGILGNSHLMMLEENSDQIAELIQVWLCGKSLWSPGPAGYDL